MARPTYPRSHRRHAAAAADILARHERVVGAPVTLPVPIELIIEQTYRLQILWEEIAEPHGTIILGALVPRRRMILLNLRREGFFEQWIGPERFTLAHELAHWVYDADNPDQLTLDLGGQRAEQYCYRRDSPGLSDDLRLREVNANKLADHLLMPEELVRAASIDNVLSDLRGTAERWQVSRTALEIRLEELGLIGNRHLSQARL